MAVISKSVVDKVMKQAQQTTKISGAYGQMFNKKQRLQKFKYEANGEKTLIFPLKLGIPFNPQNPFDETYHEKNRFFLPMSVESAWEVLHTMCIDNENPEIEQQEDIEKFSLRATLQDYLGVDLSEIQNVPLESDNYSAKDRFGMVKRDLFELAKTYSWIADEDIDTIEVEEAILTSGKSLDDVWENVIVDLSKKFKTDLSHIKLVNGEIKENFWEAQGKALCLLLKDWRLIQPKGTWTCKINIPSLNQYAIKHSIDVTYDADGNRQFGGTLYRLSCLENEFIKPEMKELEKKLGKDGEWYSLNKEQKSIKRREVRSKACIGVPVFMSVITFLCLERDGEKLETEFLKNIKSRGLKSASCYMSVDDGTITMIQKNIGSKYDRTPSYTSMEYTIGADEEPLDRMRNTTRSHEKTTLIANKIENFYKDYLAMRDDLTVNEDENLLISVPGFSKMQDAVLIEAYQSILASYKRDVYREEVVSKYKDVIRLVDAELADSLETDLIKEKLAKEVILDKEIAGFKQLGKVDAETEEEVFEDSAETGATNESDASAVFNMGDIEGSFGADFGNEFKMPEGFGM